MKEKKVLITVVAILFVISMLALAAKALAADSYWFVNERAEVKVIKVAQLDRSVNVFRLLDYQTGKIVYITTSGNSHEPPSIFVTNMDHR